MSSSSAAQPRSIIVVGSLNADLVQHVARLPRPGETVSGGELTIIPGGKGANQACAAARLGGRVRMIGQVGEDAFGPLLTNSLGDAGVDTSGVVQCQASTGTAVIFVLPSGENVIVISPGANGTLSAELVEERLASALAPTSFLLLQLEIPLAAVRVSLAMARRLGVTTVLDPAPAQSLPSALLAQVDYLTPNQSEAAFLLGTETEAGSVEEAQAAARQLVALGPSNVILKLGAQGVVLANKEGCTHVPGFAVEAIDTTAAGDTFNGAFAAALSRELPTLEAARFANAAAALSVTRRGAQSSIPDLGETDAFLSRNR